MSSDAAWTSAADPTQGLALPDTRSLDSLATRPAPPLGRSVRLAGRGRLFVRERRGPVGAPTVVLLHGWMASGGLNWLSAFGPLAQHFRVLAPDLPGHGRGSRSLRGRFELETCADEVAAMLRALDAGPAVIAGYSMGGPVAQLLWQRHREEVAGLVLCATSPTPVPQGRVASTMDGLMKGVSGASRVVDWMTLPTRRASAALSSKPARSDQLSGWARREFGRHHWPTVLDAGRALANHDASPWIGDVDVPTAVVLTKEDSAIPTDDQRAMAAQIPGASIHAVDGGHLACMRPDFGQTMVDACQGVAARAAHAAA
jgi:pimeloyl-ACP methyl ester carboxylesterase